MCGTNPRARALQSELEASRAAARRDAERTRRALHEAQLNAVAPPPDFLAARDAMRRKKNPTPPAQEATA